MFNTLLYTYQIQGDLALLPRLYTFLERLKMGRGVSIVVDLGASCTPEVWHCHATGGRSTVIVLDGMGYHCANVQGVLTAEAREKLHGVTTTALLDDQHAWRLELPQGREEGVIFSATPTPALQLNVVVAPHDRTHLIDGTLFLQTIERGQVGIVELAWEPTLTMLRQVVQTMPSNMPPHPTIASAVEFVEDEARFFQKKRLD